MTELLIEIGCEDLPARYLLPLSDALRHGLIDGLRARGIEPGAARSYATPRRIAVRIADVATHQPEQTVERRGPKLGAAFKDGVPTPAATGFARSCGVAFEELLQEDGQLVHRRQQPGKATQELIPELFDACIARMDELVPKRMRWGAGDDTFVRPVQWLLVLLGEDVVPLQRFGLTADRLSYGHRFHAPAAIALSHPGEYETRLREAFVWADVESREQDIRRQVAALADTTGGQARITDELLAEVTALVEWPVAIIGNIEPEFLQLPPEVIVATVETNQRYFTLFADAAHRQLLPHFITVANIRSRDVAQVVAGNERVVRPRLSDALFFWQQDLQQPLAALLPTLDRVTFQKDLGSTGDRVRRLSTLAAELAAMIGADPQASERAATLCKADLVSKMVFEFPELQGLMGGYYARRSGEAEAVAAAIAEHYQPTQQGTPIPSTAVGRTVALADKLDLLAGCFAVGQKPTASKDPFGLRRAALGVLRIAIEGGLDTLNLRSALARALALQPAGSRDESTLDEAWTFCVERLRGYCLDRGATPEQFEAVRANGAAVPFDVDRRLTALRSFSLTTAASSLAAADKRARNLLQKADSASSAGHVVTDHFEVPAEHALLRALEHAEAAIAPLRAKADYAAMLDVLAGLKGPVDDFFDAVMVMADKPEVRANRLALLARLDAACREVADLSCLPG